MSVLSEVHVFVNSLEPGTCYRLPLAVVDELLLCAAFISLAEFDLRCPVSSCIAATDATPIQAGMCQAEVPAKLASFVV